MPSSKFRGSAAQTPEIFKLAIGPLEKHENCLNECCRVQSSINNGCSDAKERRLLRLNVAVGMSFRRIAQEPGCAVGTKHSLISGEQP